MNGKTSDLQSEMLAEVAEIAVDAEDKCREREKRQ